MFCLYNIYFLKRNTLIPGHVDININGFFFHFLYGLKSPVYGLKLLNVVHSLFSILVLLLLLLSIQ